MKTERSAQCPPSPLFLEGIDRMANNNIHLVNKTVGSIELDQGNQVRGNGYLYNTCLWIPIIGTMQPRLEDQTLVMTELTCTLLTENQQQIGLGSLPIRVMVI